MWSRRWEYVYVLQQLELIRRQNPEKNTVADAGSGFTFFPFCLKEKFSDLKITCIDSDAIAGNAIGEAVKIFGGGPDFYLGNLEKLELPDESIDILFSISVIEHTANPRKVVDEIFHIL